MTFINILDYIVLFAKHKRFILGCVLVTFIISLIFFYLIIPRWYKSTAVVVPPRQKQMMNVMASIKAPMSSFRALGMGIQNDDIQQYLVILNSRRLKESIVKKFNLLQVYGKKEMEKAIEELESNLDIALGKEDAAVEIRAYDTDPKRAADIANYCVEVLNDIYVELSVKEAINNRKFLEERYNKCVSDLRNASEKLRCFQKKYGAYSIPDQVKAFIEYGAKLQSQIAAKEIQLALLDRSLNSNSAVRELVEYELEELRKQLKEMKYGKVGKGKEADIFIPLDITPDVGMQYLEYYRELEIQEKILEMLAPLYEQAKIEEHKNIPTVLVLDKAVPAERPSKPKRLIIILVLTIFSIIISYFIVLCKESFFNKHNVEANDLNKIDYIRRELNWRNIFK